MNWHYSYYNSTTASITEILTFTPMGKVEYFRVLKRNPVMERICKPSTGTHPWLTQGSNLETFLL